MNIGKIKFALCTLHFQIFNNIAKGDALEAQALSPVFAAHAYS